MDNLCLPGALVADTYHTFTEIFCAHTMGWTYTSVHDRSKPATDMSADSSATYEITLEVTRDQELAIEAFFVHNGWDYRKKGTSAMIYVQGQIQGKI